MEAYLDSSNLQGTARITYDKYKPVKKLFGIFHGAINEPDDGPIEICIPVDGNLKAEGDVQVKQLQGGSAACVVMIGTQTDFPAILGAYDAAADWIQKNGYQMADSPREVWHSGPGSGEEPKMEIVWLFK